MILAVSLAVAAAPPVKPPAIVIAPPPGQIEQFTAQRRSADRSLATQNAYDGRTLMSIDIEGNGQHLWSGELPIGTSSSVLKLGGVGITFDHNCSPIAAAAAPRTGLEISATDWKSQYVRAVQLDLTWIRAEPSGCPTGTRTVQLHEIAPLPTTGPVEIKGDGGLVVRIAAEAPKTQSARRGAPIAGAPDSRRNGADDGMARVKLDISGQGRHLWSGELSAGLTSGGSVRLMGVDSPIDIDCPPSTRRARSDTELAVSMSRFAGQVANAFQIRVIWKRAEPYICASGTRQVELDEAVPYPLVKPVDLYGDAGLIVRVRPQ